jgi:hypothetical protein
MLAVCQPRVSTLTKWRIKAVSIRLSEYSEGKNLPLLAQRLGQSKVIPLVPCMTCYRENFTFWLWRQKCAERAVCYTSNRRAAVTKILLLRLTVSTERSSKNGTNTLYINMRSQLPSLDFYTQFAIAFQLTWAILIITISSYVKTSPILRIIY